MNIDIITASREDLPIVHQLARLYRYDLSEFADWSVPVDADYIYPGLEDYWGKGYLPLIIKVNGELAGFVILSDEKCDLDSRYECVEFFVMRKFRGQGVGKHVALHLFNQYRGQWVIKQLASNKPANAFWNKIVADYTNDAYESGTRMDQEFGEIYLIRFDNS